MKNIRLIPFVCGAGASLPGCEAGPVAAKKFGLDQHLGNASRHVAWQEDPETLFARERKFYENLPALGTPERDAIVLRNCIHIAQQVEDVVKSGAMPVTIGGDHANAAGSIAGFARAKKAHGKIGLVWVDAHADINTPDTSITHALHGMPIAALLGLINNDFGRIGGDVPVLKAEHLVYAGMRDTDPAEDRLLEDLNIRKFPREGFSEELFLESVDEIAANADYLIFSIDLDAFDPEFAPAVGTPVKSGFQRGKLLSTLEKLERRHKPDMVEIVEYNPGLPGAEQTYNLMREVLETVIPA